MNDSREAGVVKTLVPHSARETESNEGKEEEPLRNCKVPVFIERAVDVGANKQMTAKVEPRRVSTQVPYVPSWGRRCLEDPTKNAVKNTSPFRTWSSARAAGVTGKKRPTVPTRIRPVLARNTGSLLSDHCLLGASSTESTQRGNPSLSSL